jgi:hypothetical protein
MVWVVDDLVEAALGPWGLAVGLGVGLLAAARQRRAAVTPDDATAATAAGGFAGVVALADGVKGRIQATLAEAGDSWRDLYAEAHHEWEQSRSGAAGADVAATIAIATPSGTVVSEQIVPQTVGKRVRGPNGRYTRE